MIFNQTNNNAGSVNNVISSELPIMVNQTKQKVRRAAIVRVSPDCMVGLLSLSGDLVYKMTGLPKSSRIIGCKWRNDVCGGMIEFVIEADEGLMTIIDGQPIYPINISVEAMIPEEAIKRKIC